MEGCGGRTGKITLENLRRKEEIEGIKDKVSETSLSMGVLIKNTTQQLKKSMMQYQMVWVFTLLPYQNPHYNKESIKV